MSFFSKVLLIVIASAVFVLAVMYISSFRKSVIEEKRISDFKMKTMDVLQKLISDGSCLAFEQNGTPQKGVVDIDKLNSFVLKYNETEPECAKTLGFDYNIKVVQFSLESRTYPEPIIEKKCYDRCYHRGYRCTTICYKVCEDKIIESPSYKVSIPAKTWSFGAPKNSFSPEKAKLHELQVSFPVTVRHNETFATEGVLYIYAAKGELEEVYSSLEDLCQKSRFKPDTDIKFSRQFYFSYPVKLIDNKLCMLNSCKKIVCPFSVKFKDFDAGEHLLTFVYDSNSRSININ